MSGLVSGFVDDLMSRKRMGKRKEVRMLFYFRYIF